MAGSEAGSQAGSRRGPPPRAGPQRTASRGRRTFWERPARGPGGGPEVPAAPPEVTSAGGLPPPPEEKTTMTTAAMTLRNLPIDVQLYILSFLSPHDLCQLGSVDRYWNLTIRDPLLWRYFLLRDLPSWSSVDWKSLPDMQILKNPFPKDTDGVLSDYMSIYKMSCPHTRRCLKSSHPIYGAVTSFLQSLVIHSEPRFAMFGPGLEELNNSLVLRMMSCTELSPVAGLPQRQIDGIGSGISFQLSNQQKFNILILYSTTRKERDRAREEQTNVVNKMFNPEQPGSEQKGGRYNVIPQIQRVCEVVDGFIYVANAEAHKRHERQEEFSRISAMTNAAFGSQARPLLVLSCVSQADIERTPCFYVAHELCLNRLGRPWMVQDTEAAGLTGLSGGIEWLLGEVDRRRTR
ncbi:F-box only protein 4 [Ornithorhynchus anatinus]|uniref:F-box protein 4 n=1 Tax=Ornithorhynchus anatinus TaxID=9258 RepID=F7FM21_ORNAN|nr:F-box only protein 4 [Ornithorhynchus anatinus]